MAPFSDLRESEAISRHGKLDRCSPRGPCPLPRFSTFTTGNSCCQPYPAANIPILPQGTASFLVSQSTQAPSPGLTHCAPLCAPCCPSNPFSHPNWGGVPAAWAGLPCWDESPLSYELFLPEVSFAWLGWLGLDCWRSCGRPCQTQEVLQQGLKA